MLGRTLKLHLPFASGVPVPATVVAISTNGFARIVTTSPALPVETVPLSVDAAQQVTIAVEAAIEVVTTTCSGAAVTAAVRSEVVTSEPYSFAARTETRSANP